MVNRADPRSEWRRGFDSDSEFTYAPWGKL